MRAKSARVERAMTVCDCICPMLQLLNKSVHRIHSRSQSLDPGKWRKGSTFL